MLTMPNRANAQVARAGPVRSVDLNKPARMYVVSANIPVLNQTTNDSVLRTSSAAPSIVKHQDNCSHIQTGVMLQQEDSNDRITSLSDLYKDDLIHGAIFVVDHPTSQKRLFTLTNVLINRSKYLIDDAAEPFDRDSHLISGPHTILPVLGSRLRVYTAELPSQTLLRHWERRLGLSSIDLLARCGNFGELVPHVCSFPLEQLDARLHAVDPDVHYEIYSKTFITEIDCPQPAVLTELKIPSILKVCRSYGASGTFKITSPAEYDNRMQKIAKTMPWAKTILTELVPDVEHDLGCHVYINRKGDVTWLAAIENIIDDTSVWLGASLQTSKQEEFRRLAQPAIKPVTEALHRLGYFGLVGIDVLLDVRQQPYVIDVNPRRLGSTPLVFTQIALQTLGRRWDAAVFQKNVVVNASSVEEVIKNAEDLNGEDVEVVVYAVYEKKESKFGYNVGVFGRSMEECRKTINLLKY